MSTPALAPAPPAPNKCACGVGMIEYKPDRYGEFCPNCDRLSPDELAGENRVVTPADRRFTAAWRERFERIFPKHMNRTTPIEKDRRDQ